MSRRPVGERRGPPSLIAALATVRGGNGATHAPVPVTGVKEQRTSVSCGIVLSPETSVTRSECLKAVRLGGSDHDGLV